MSKDKTGWNKYRRGPRAVKSNELKVQVQSLGNSGEGIARHDGQVVFVPFTLPGETALVQPFKRKSTYIHSTLIKLIERSDERVTPSCAYFKQCGGCDWQHVPYAMQLDTKEGILGNVLQRIGKVDNPPVRPILPNNTPYHYRNRIQGIIKNKRFHFKKRSSNELIAIDACAIAEPDINQFLRDSLHDSSELPDGRVEIAVTDNGVSCYPLNDNNSTELGFRQVNSYMSEQLSSLVHNIAEQTEYTHCLDLYCGHGNWSMALAERQSNTQFIGIDSSADNIRQANRRAANTKLANVSFKLGRVEDLISTLPLAHSLCIVDPPRAGLDKRVSEALCLNPPQRLVYVSCHPASLARDIAHLTESNFSLIEVTPLDMFPQTAHVESVSVLERR